jgi:hypothetical protein
MSTEAKIRSLTRNQIKVLYWKCKDEQYGQIAVRYQRTVKWVQGLVTSSYRKLEVPPGSSAEMTDFLKSHFCETIHELVGAEENLEKWPLHGMKVVEEKGGKTTYQEREKDDADEPSEGDETVEGEAINWEDYVKQKEGEEKREERTHQGSTEPADRERSTEPTTRSNAWLRIFFIGAAIVLLWFVFFRPDSQQNNPPDITSTQDTSSATDSTSAPQSTNPPEAPSTSSIPPTAVPLPIKEDFSTQYSDLWWVSGNPLVVGRVWSPYDGVVTTQQNEYVTLWIGNTAWKNYVVAFRAWRADSSELNVGVRVSDLNNSVQFECIRFNCHWLIISDGARDQIPGEQAVTPDANFTFTVQGDTYTMLVKSAVPEVRMSLILPPKYKHKFQDGGVLFQFTNIEIDYIEINPLP